MPMRLAVRITRQAISPRLAIRSFLNMAPGEASQRDVIVLLPRVGELLVAQHRQCPAEAAAGRRGLDHIVDKAAPGGDKRVGEFLAVFLGARVDLGLVLEVGAEDDLDRADLKDQAKIDARTEEYREKFANPFVAAGRGFIDDVIQPSTTRRRLCRALAMLRDKQLANPWKKHDNIPL